jgi:hypothetical protein
MKGDQEKKWRSWDEMARYKRAVEGARINVIIKECDKNRP